MHTGYVFVATPGAGTDCSYRRWRNVPVHGPVVTLMEPGEIHWSRETTWTTECRVITVASDAVLTALGATRPWHFRTAVDSHPGLYDRIVAAFRTLWDGAAEPLGQDEALLDAIRLSFVRNGEEPIAERGLSRHARIARVRARLHATFHERHSLDALASEAGVTPFHLIRCFKAELGCSPFEYLLQLRVRRARELLVAGRAPADVAIDVGFFDQSHLHRHFRRIVGVTPGQFVRATA